MSQFPPPPSAFPPADPGRSTKRTTTVIIAAALVLVLGVGAVSVFAGRQTHTVGASASAKPTPTASSGSQQISGTFEMTPFPQPHGCEPPGLTLTAYDVANAELGSTPLHLTAKGGVCRGTFSLSIAPSGAVTIGLGLTDPTGQPLALVGPEDSAARLAQIGDHVTLQLGQFALNAELRDADARFAKIFAAVQTYHKASGSFAGLDATKMHEFVPAVTFNDGDAAVTGEVSVREVTDGTILFVMGLPSGVPYCRGIKPPKEGSYGYTDAQTYDECLQWQGVYPTPTPGVA